MLTLLSFSDVEFYVFSGFEMEIHKKNSPMPIMVIELTRETIAEAAFGDTEIRLPGRPYMAVLATIIPSYSSC